MSIGELLILCVYHVDLGVAVVAHVHILSLLQLHQLSLVGLLRLEHELECVLTGTHRGCLLLLAKLVHLLDLGRLVWLRLLLMVMVLREWVLGVRVL